MTTIDESLAVDLTASEEQETVRVLRSMVQNPKVLTRSVRNPRITARLLGLKPGPGHSARNAKLLRDLSYRVGVLAASIEGEPEQNLLQAAQTRGDHIREELVKTGRLVGGGEFVQALSISRQALSKAVRAGRMFAVEHGGQNYYPAFFASPKLERRRVERIASVLKDRTGWEKWLFFSMPKTSLGRRTPIEAMEAGMYAAVARAAAGYAER